MLFIKRIRSNCNRAVDAAAVVVVVDIFIQQKDWGAQHQHVHSQYTCIDWMRKY